MNNREKRVIKAFISSVKNGRMSYDEAVLAIEDTERYGYLSESAKEVFYAEFEEVEEIPTEDIPSEV